MAIDEQSSPTFDNQQILIDELPQASNIDFLALDPAALTASRISNAIFFAVVAIAFLLVNFIFLKLTLLKLITVIAIQLLLFLLAFVVAGVNYRHRGYCLREHDLIYKRGWLFYNVLYLPINRIQHMETYRGPLQRKFQLATLRFYSAGGISADLEIPGLQETDAESLRQAILSKANVPLSDKDEN